MAADFFLGMHIGFGVAISLIMAFYLWDNKHERSFKLYVLTSIVWAIWPLVLVFLLVQESYDYMMTKLRDGETVDIPI